MEKDDFTISEEEIKALVKESLEPTPRAGITRIEIDQLFVSARDSLQSLSKMVLDGLKPPSGAYAFFNHNAHALSQLQDCKKIVDRMYAGRIKLTDLSREQNSLMPKDWPAGVPYPENVQKIMRDESEVNEYMQIDLESLYMFGGILLDQWGLLVIAVGNLKSNKRHPFVDVYSFLESEEDSILRPIWINLRKEIIWLQYQMRFYRNRFIVHANRPWQRGTNRSVIGGDYSLHTPTPPGWLDDEKLDNEIRALIHLAPEYIQRARDDYREKERPGALIERIFDNIGNIEKKEDREKVADIYSQKGGMTASYQVLAKNLFNFIFQATTILNNIAKNNLKNIDLGKPFMTSEEMWKKRNK